MINKFLKNILGIMIALIITLPNFGFHAIPVLVSICCGYCLGEVSYYLREFIEIMIENL